MDMNENLLSKSMIVNIECHFWIIREFLPHMLETNKGQIVSVASMAGLVGNPYMTDYCASKFAACGMMESLRIELKRAKKDIVCTTICPGFINTGMFAGAKGSLIFPVLEQDYVIKRMTNGILQNEEEIYMTNLACFIAHFCKAILPVCALDLVSWACVGWDAMADFTGRQ